MKVKIIIFLLITITYCGEIYFSNLSVQKNQNNIGIAQALIYSAKSLFRLVTFVFK